MTRGRRILVLSNFYPPVVFGGYEVECAGVVERLRRDNEVLVLASRRGRRRARAAGPEEGVERSLPYMARSRLTRALAPLYAALGARAARRALRRFQPDLVYVWNGAQVPQAAIRVLETSGAVVAYRVCEHWFGGLYRSINDPFMRGLAGGPWRRLMTVLNALPPLRLEASRPVGVSVCWNSEMLRRQVGVPPPLSPLLERVVIPATEQSEAFVDLKRRPAAEPTFGFVGRVAAEKGVDVAICALAELTRRGRRIRLEVAGGAEPGLRRRLEGLAAELGVADRVAFLGRCELEDLKHLYQRLNCLLVPSTWEEPAGLVLVEGALAGVPLVASRVGGIPEIVRDGEEALLCPPGDAVALAAAMERVLAEPEATAERVARARLRVERFRVAAYQERMAEFLDDAIAAAA